LQNPFILTPSFKFNQSKNLKPPNTPISTKSHREKKKQSYSQFPCIPRTPSFKFKQNKTLSFKFNQSENLSLPTAMESKNSIKSKQNKTPIKPTISNPPETPPQVLLSSYYLEIPQTLESHHEFSNFTGSKVTEPPGNEVLRSQLILECQLDPPNPKEFANRQASFSLYP